jgi:putative transposase
MPNHVHLVLIPTTAHGLCRALKIVHGHYAQRVNRMRDLKGHLWQGRYFSSALDADYFVNAVRYVELNPVRAGLARRAEEYPWSSAAAHCGRRSDPLVTDRTGSPVFAGISDWSRWLAAGLTVDRCDELRRHARQNLPCGSPAFVDVLERLAGRPLRHKPTGRRSETRTEDP